MEISILIVSLLILIETSILIFRRFHPNFTNNKRKIYIDTSALIDGRIVAVAKTGFLEGDLIILKSVLFRTRWNQILIIAVLL